jgi:signal transduction histidine kinase
MWRAVAHDMRGTVSVISNASAILTSDAVEDPARTQFSGVLERSVASLRGLIGDLLDLGRLEAGQEQRNIVAFDATAVLREFCESMRVLASQRNLFLKTDGPPTLPVMGDPTKVRRIVQNLVLNALSVTERGGVLVTWQEREVSGTQQWIVCVQDTGPGLDIAHAAPFEQMLKQATAESQDVERRAAVAGDDAASSDAAPTLASKSTHPSTSAAGGEGIGLSIVKRLCELLDASMELETAAGTGTTFRIVLPRNYDTSSLIKS